MSAIITPLLAALSSMFMSLMTEAFLKKMLIMSLGYIAKRTETDIDDKIYHMAKKEWDKPS